MCPSLSPHLCQDKTYRTVSFLPVRRYIWQNRPEFKPNLGGRSIGTITLICNAPWGVGGWRGAMVSKLIYLAYNILQSHNLILGTGAFVQFLRFVTKLSREGLKNFDSNYIYCFTEILYWITYKTIFLTRLVHWKYIKFSFISRKWLCNTRKKSLNAKNIVCSQKDNDLELQSVLASKKDEILYFNVTYQINICYWL